MVFLLLDFYKSVVCTRFCDCAREPVIRSRGARLSLGQIRRDFFEGFPEGVNVIALNSGTEKFFQ